MEIRSYSARALVMEAGGRGRDRALQVLLGATIVLLGSMVLSLSARATALYPDVNGLNFDFTGIQETSSFGDPEPLFGAPIGSGDQLLFFPPNFTAEASGAGGFDQTGSQLQLQITSNSPTSIIEQILLTEFGDSVLTGIGTSATGTFISMSGVLTVQETTAGPLGTSVVIPFTGTFTPTDLLGLPGDAGTTLWQGSVLIDVESVVPNATKAFLSFDNDMIASSEDGTSAKIQKKVVSGPAIKVKVIPEPGTGLLVMLGLGVLGLRARK